MEKLNKENVISACEELKGALIETIELDEKEQGIKLLQIKARNRLMMARDTIHSLKLNL